MINESTHNIPNLSVCIKMCCTDRCSRGLAVCVRVGCGCSQPRVDPSPAMYDSYACIVASTTLKWQALEGPSIRTFQLYSLISQEALLISSAVSKAYRGCGTLLAPLEYIFICDAPSQGGLGSVDRNANGVTQICKTNSSRKIDQTIHDAS